MKITDERIAELRAACSVPEGQEATPFDIQGEEIAAILEELQLYRSQLPKEPHALANVLGEFINQAGLDEPAEMLAAHYLVCGLTKGSSSWKPHTVVCALIDMMSSVLQVDPIDIVRNVSGAMVRALAKRGNAEAKQVMNNAMPVRRSRPHRTVTVGRRATRR